MTTPASEHYWKKDSRKHHWCNQVHRKDLSDVVRAQLVIRENIVDASIVNEDVHSSKSFYGPIRQGLKSFWVCDVCQDRDNLRTRPGKFRGNSFYLAWRRRCQNEIHPCLCEFSGDC